MVRASTVGARLNPGADEIFLPEADTDLALLARAREGDPDAFRRLVERFEDVVAGVVVGMLGPGAEADDVGQETFIRFYRSMQTFRGDAALGTYLTRIAMNLSLNALKRRKRTSRRFLRIDDGAASRSHSETIPAPAPLPDGEVIRNDRERAVRTAIETLDDKHRPIVVLRMIQGMSTRETAQALGVPEGTVLSRLSRALNKLETELQGWMNDE